MNRFFVEVIHGGTESAQPHRALLPETAQQARKAQQIRSAAPTRNGYFRLL